MLHERSELLTHKPQASASLEGSFTLGQEGVQERLFASRLVAAGREVARVAAGRAWVASGCIGWLPASRQARIAAANRKAKWHSQAFAAAGSAT